MDITNKNIEAWSAALARGEAVTFRSSRAKAIGRTLAAAVIVLLCLVMASTADAGILWKTAGWIGAIMFGLGVVVNVFRLLSRAPVVMVSSDGIAMNGASVAWAQITGINPVKQYSNVYIELVVTDEQAERQTATGHGSSERELHDSTTVRVLRLPNGLAVHKPELCYWLEQEREARASV